MEAVRPKRWKARRSQARLDESWFLGTGEGSRLAEATVIVLDEPRQPPRAARSAIRSGCTRSTDPVQAADELFALLGGDDIAAVLLFCSSHRDLDGLARALTDRFGDVTVVGCTSSGELTPFGYLDGTITGIAFPRDDFALSIARLDDLGSLDVTEAERRVHLLAEEADAAARRLGDAAQQLAVFLVDGLSKKEEMFAIAVHDALGDVPMIGGSTGDDLAFEQTYVLHEGAFHRHAALLVVISTTRPFRIFRHHHLRPTATKMVVTAANPARRVVTEINAEPAAAEYARLTGIGDGDLSSMTFAMHPVMVRGGGDYHVRAIQKVNDDGSLTFYCAIDEGIVLSVAEGGDILEELKGLFTGIEAEIGAPEIVLGFDCVHRALEIEQRQLKQAASDLLVANRVIGFSTYGEQFNALHVNQTFTGVAFGRG